MDPYYQQGVQQPQAQAIGQQQAASMVGVPSAPPMQSSTLSHHSQQQGQPPQQTSHQQQQQQQQQQQPQQQQQQQQSSQGHHRSYQQQAQHHSQQQQLAGQPNYATGMDPMGYQVGGGQQSRQNGTSGYHMAGASSHHHGGQAPLPPHHSSGGHSSSGRYGHRERSALMHQHRSSAAAISDPMMASTITDQLASASGPMTGSGSALNQLGLSGGGYGGQRSATGNYYGRDQLYPGGGVDPMFSSSGAPAGGYSGGHQSRYDSHYSSRTRGHSSGPLGYGGSGTHSMGFAGTTTAGAYHLDRNDPSLGNPAKLAGGRSDPRAGGGYYPAQNPMTLHQSLGNLPSATAASSRYASHMNDPLLGQYTGGMHDGRLAGGYPLGGYDSGRMQPVGATTGFQPVGDSLGLGSYNPLEDPLATHQLANHQQQMAATQRASEIQFGSSANYQLSAGGVGASSRDMLITELRARLQEAQSSYAAVKRELETTTQKLGSSMHSIKSFWSPELKKERALRKEEATKYALINDQMKLMRVEVQKQALLIRQLEEELKLAHETRIRTQDPDTQQHIDALCTEKEQLFKENCLLRDTIRELEMRLEAQKQTLAARDDSIKRMVEMMNNKGIASRIMEDERLEMERTKTRNIDLETRCRHYESIIESKEKDLIKNSPHQATSEISGRLSAVPKSPIPMERKSILNNDKTEQSTSRPSRTERLKSRLFSKHSSSKSNGRPAEEKGNDNSPSNSSSLVSSSSSSGISSSRGSDLQQELSSPENESNRSEDKPNSIQSKGSKPTNCVDGIYKLCQCDACKSSGQAIYSRSKSLDPIQKPELRVPTPPRSGLRKAVSFRSSVEHIGSPRFQPPKTEAPGANSAASSSLAAALMEDARPEMDSCDSMHVNKDFSFMNGSAGEQLTGQGGDSNSGDHLRPIDCSTPKNQSDSSCRPMMGAERSVERPTGNSIKAEVHRPATLSNPSYTCLCSPDFICSHNGYGQREAPKMPVEIPLRVEAQQQYPVNWQQRRQPMTLSNDLYGVSMGSDFPLSRDCIECKNLSTYVNLSRLGPSTSNQSRQERSMMSVASNNSSGIIKPNSSVNGYDSGDYKRLLRSKQNDVYGSLVTTRMNDQPTEIPTGGKIINLDESSHYLAAARQLRQSIGNCDLCNEHFKQQKSSQEACSCGPAASGNVPGLTVAPNDVNPDLASLTSKSYHTASSGSLQVAPAGSAVDSTQGLIDVSQLSVLPVGSTSTSRLNNYSSASTSNNNNIDSSLSSLFVYRHISDNDQPVDEFDPDSLEIKPTEESAINCSKSAKSIKSALPAKSANAAATSGGWLRNNRQRGEYILLSSTTSNPSKSSSSNNSGPSNESRATKPNSGLGSKLGSGKSSSFVQADVTQSSLAKRRQLSNSLQQQQSMCQQTKRKVPTGKSATSAPAGDRQANKQSSTTTHTRSNSSASNRTGNHAASSESATIKASNVKSIYQSVKNHLFDIRKSSSNQTTASKFNAPIGSSLSLPRSHTLSSLAKSRTSKSAQMEELRTELVRRDQELLTIGAKLKAMEDQQRDSQRHIRVLKDELMAKEKRYTLLQADAEELRRQLEDRNEFIEKRNNYRQTFGSASSKSNACGNAGYANQAEMQELAQLLELREKKCQDLQRKVMQLDALLNERDSQLDRMRMRFEHGTGIHSGQGGADTGMLNNLQETLGDKERQISLLRDQRDRAEHELGEERDSHERSIKEYKMKLNSVKFEMDKLQNRLGKDSKYGTTSDYSVGGTDPSLVKRLETDKRSLQLEIDRLRDKLIESTGSSTGRRGLGVDRASSALGGGGDYSVVEFERLQETLESLKQELRRAQAECRMNEMERKRAHEEADKLSERYERSQGEMHKLKAKLENAISEREQLLEDYERQQQMISQTQTERDSALADINSIKLDNDRLQQSYNRIQLECEKLQAQLERIQHECRKFEDRCSEQADELRKAQADKSNAQRELKRLQVSLEAAEMQQQRAQQEKESSRLELDKIRDRYERLEADMERFLHDKELNSQQVSIYKERIEQQQQQLNKMIREKEQMSMEIHELRERLHKQQKLQDTSEHETRNEVRIWKEKYERLLAQFEKLNEDMANKQKENQMVIEKFQRIQSEAVKLESKLEQSEMDRERAAIELERSQQISSKVKEDYKKWQDETQQLQEMYTKTNTKLLKLTEIEERLRIDYDKCQMDLEVLRERYEKLQAESRRLQSEKDRLQVECDRLKFDQEQRQIQAHHQQLAGTAGKGPVGTPGDEFARISGELERSVAKLEQYQREINKLQLEKERLLIDSKTSLQQTEQQFQQQVLKMKSSEEKLTMELERARTQLEKVQSKHEQTNVDQEKLVADKERLQQQLLLLQQEVDKFRNQQSTSAQETKRLHDDEMQRVLQELETIREKYTQQRKELLQLREVQQNHELDKDILKRELESAEARLEKLNQTDAKQRQDSERCLIEIEKMKDKVERKQQELLRAQKERNQFAQEITVLHKQIQQLQTEYEQLQRQQQLQQQQPQQQQQQQQGQPQQQPQQQQQQVKNEEINKLKQMLVKSETDLQKTTAENQRFQMEVERLKLQLDDAAEYIAKIESGSQMLQKQNQEIIQQLNQMQQQPQQEQQQPQQEQQQPQQKSQQKPQQQQDVERLQQEMKKMQDVIKKSANEIQKLVEERNGLQEANKEMQRQVEQTKIDFTATIEQYEAELTRLQKENQQQKKQQPQAAAASAQSEEYKVKFEKAVEAIRAFQKTSDDMKKEIIKLNEHNKSLSEQNQALAQSLKANEENLQKQLQQASGQQQQQKGQDGEQQGASAKEADEMHRQIVQLSEVCQKLEKDLKASSEEAKKHLASNQQLKQALSKSQSELGGLKTDRDRFQSQLEKLMVELEHRENELAKLGQQQDKSGANLQAKQNELIEYQKKLEEREKALEAKRNELQAMQEQIQKGAASGASAGQANAQMQETINKSQQQVRQLEDERNKLRGELERVRNELRQSQAELERLLKILSASEEDKFNLTQQIEQLQNKLRSAPPAGGQQQQPQQARGPPPPPGQQHQQQQPRPPGPQQQQQRPQGPPQQQQRPPNPNQKPSGAGGFISGLFQ